MTCTVAFASQIVSMLSLNLYPSVTQSYCTTLVLYEGGGSANGITSISNIFTCADFYIDACCGWKSSTECRATEALKMQIMVDSLVLSDLRDGDFFRVGALLHVTNITLYCGIPPSGLRGELTLPLSGVSCLSLFPM